MTAPRVSLHRVLLTTTLLVGALLALPTAPAQARLTHPLISSFDGSDAPGGPFGLSLADAVDNSTGTSAGDVYVGELNSSTFASDIDKFDGSGHVIPSFGAGGQITGADTPAGSFSLLNFDTFANAGIAVDSSASASSGDLYVADAGNGVVDRFDPSGAFLCQITGAGSAATDLPDECDGADPGAPAGSLSPTGVTVGAGGKLYVADAANNVVDQFDASGKYLGQISDSHITQAGALALDSAGNLYLFNGSGFQGGGDVLKFDSGGSFVSIFVAGVATGVSVNPTNDHVLVDEADSSSGQGQIAEFDAAGTPVTTFAGPAGYLTAAVSSATGDIYAPSIFGSRVEVYGPLVVIPDVATGAATNVDQTSATLNGHVDPDAAHGGGDVTDCHFEYTDDASFQANGYSGAQSAPCTPATPISSPADVSADISGLAPDTTYHFRLDANNANGFVNQGQDQAFTTRGPPVIDSQSSTAGTTTATLRAQINPFGLDTTCQVQYVDDAGFQSSGYAGAATLPCTPADLGSGFTGQSAAVSLTGLQVATTYHFRFLATNQAGPTTGKDQTFATFGISSFSFSAVDQNGQPYTQAGGHPYQVTTSFDLNTTTTASGNPGTDANLKDVDTELPPGLIGDPTATPKCTSYELRVFDCSGAAQVGVLHLRTGGAGLDAGLYNLVAPAGVPAQFGAVLNSGFEVFIEANVRTGGDYGITANVVNAGTQVGVTGVTVNLWGVPADPSHDAERFCPDPATHDERAPCSANEPLRPFLTNPTSCAGPQTATLRADSWQDPGDFVSATSTLPANTGCDRLDFTPSLTVQPDTGSADSPSGLHVDLGVPQNDNPDGLAEANLKKAVVTLPPGTSVNPAAADGLAACSPAQIGLNNASEPTCPDGSKVGSVEVDTPLLSDPLKGSVYVAEQSQNPFDSLLAVYLTAEADGALVKLAGHVVPDPNTGQLETTFDNNPQLPFSDFKLDFFGGPRAALATPQTCGSYPITSQLTPWSDPNTASPATPTDAFSITSGPGGGPCPNLTDPAKFTPGFQAGTVTPLAGSYSPFVLKITRPDGQQYLKQIHIDMPPGLVANLNGVPRCSQAQITPGIGGSANCPAGSQIGTVNVGAGAGSPFFLKDQPVYLTDGYNGAPYGIAIDTHALAGPFDLGHVVVRSTLNVDKDDAQVHIDSEQLPDILQGIPLRIRSVAVKIDKPNFILNPTNCSPMTVTGSVTGGGADFNAPGDDTTKPVSTPFQVSGCGGLGFSPHLSGAILNGAQGIHRSDHPNLQFNLAYHPGDANLASVAVLLPQAFQIDQANLGNICSETQLAQNECAGRNTVGTASATTPILGSTLSGPVYAVSGSGGLPKLAVILHGPPTDPITLVVRGITDTVGARIRNTFPLVPDAPVNNFTLTLNGGPAGYLVNNTNVCGKRVKRHGHKKLVKTPLNADANFTAQDGDTRSQSVPISAACPRKKAKHRHSKGKRH